MHERSYTKYVISDYGTGFKIQCRSLLMPRQVPKCERDDGVAEGGIPVGVRPRDVTQERFLHHV